MEQAVQPVRQGDGAQPDGAGLVRPSVSALEDYTRNKLVDIRGSVEREGRWGSDSEVNSCQGPQQGHAVRYRQTDRRTQTDGQTSPEDHGTQLTRSADTAVHAKGCLSGHVADIFPPG